MTGSLYQEARTIRPSAADCKTSSGTLTSFLKRTTKETNPDLVEAVSQIRRFRNWVAHGRQEGKKPVNTTPRDALDRLNAFLELIGHRPVS